MAKGQWFLGKIEIVLSSQHIVSQFMQKSRTPCYPKAFQSKCIWFSVENFDVNPFSCCLTMDLAKNITDTFLRSDSIHKWPQVGTANLHYTVLNNVHMYSHSQTPNLFCSCVKDKHPTAVGTHAGSVTAERFTTNALLCPQPAGG